MKDSKQPLIKHFNELRERLLYSFLFFLGSFIIGYVFAKDIYQILVYPLAMQDANIRMIYTGLMEGFFTYLKVAFHFAFLIFIPFLLVQIWLFIAPGLYKKERVIIQPFLILSPLFFVLGGLFAYFFVMPSAWQFFLSFQNLLNTHYSVPIELMPRVSEYLSLIMSFIFGFGLAFQLPLILIFLLKKEIINLQGLIRFRRYMIVTSFVLAAILTPPDVLSQLFLAGALVLIYEFIILFIKYKK